MNKKNSLIGATDIVLIVTTFLMVIGINTWFKTCGPMEDGTYMACHWAGQAVKGLAALALVLAVVRIPVRDRMFRAGVDVSIALLAVLTALVPGRLISLCMMEDMMCRSHTQPWTIGLSILLLLAAAVDVISCCRAAADAKHSRA